MYSTKTIILFKFINYILIYIFLLFVFIIMLIEGTLPQEYLKYADNIKDFFLKIHGGYYSKSKHYWVDEIQEKNIKDSLNILRNAEEIKKEIQKLYPDHIIKSIYNTDEIYIGVDPSLQKNSDIVLSECHYDGPFKHFPNFGNKFLRVILGLTENKTVYTTIEDQKSTLSTLDFNIMDYNNDYHCVEGYIPKNNIRILLKIHFLCINKNSPVFFVNLIEYINNSWAHFSRYMMSRSIEPKNIFDNIILYSIYFSNLIYYNFKIFLLFLLLIYFYFYKIKN
jgi:hypothetical protein